MKEMRLREIRPATLTTVSFVSVLGAGLSVGWLLAVVRPENRALLLLLVGGLAGISATSAVIGSPAARSSQLWRQFVGWLIVVLLAALLVPQRVPMQSTSLTTLLLVVVGAACIGFGAGVTVRVARHHGVV